MTTVLKKIRLYCIISKYDSFIHVRGGKKWRTKNAFTKHMYTFWKVQYLGVLSNEMKGRKLNKNRVECYERKILSEKEQKCKRKSLIQNVYKMA